MAEIEILGDVGLEPREELEILGDIGEGPFLVSGETEAQKQAREDVELQEEIEAGRVSLTELPPEMRQRLGYMMPGELGPAGMPLPGEKPVQVTPPAEVKEYFVESPHAYQTLKGMEAALPIPEKSKIPSFQETFEREPDLSEKAVGLISQLATEAPAILAAIQTGAVVTAPIKLADYTGKRLAIKMLNRGAQMAMREGVAGGLYHSTRKFSEEMLNTGEEIDYGKLAKEMGKEFAEGFAWWGSFGFVGGNIGAAWGNRAVRKMAKGFDKLKAKLNHSSMAARLLDSPEIMKEYGQPVIEVTAPGFGRRFGSVELASKFADDVFAKEHFRHLGKPPWDAFHKGMETSYDKVVGEMLMNHRTIGQANAVSGKLIGNIPVIAQRVENLVFGPRNIMRLKKAAAELAVPVAERNAWLRQQLKALEGYKIFSTIIDPVMEGERKAWTLQAQLATWIHRDIVGYAKGIEKKYGKSVYQIAMDQYELLASSWPREAVNPKEIVNAVQRWRGWVDKSGIEAYDRIKGEIKKFVASRNMPKKAEDLFEELAMGKKANLALGPKYVEKRFGDMIKPAPSQPAKGRLAPAHTKRMAKLKRELENAPEAERAAIEAEFGEPIARFEELVAARDITPEEIILAKRIRRSFNAMFNMAGLDAATYMKFYVPLVERKDILTMKQVEREMKGLPHWVKARMKHFFEMHRSGEVFSPEKDVFSLLNMYAWGGARARHLSKVINEAREQLSSKYLKNTPLRNLFDKFLDDSITGIKHREKTIILSSIRKWSNDKIPFEVLNELAETMISNVYAATMGLRIWLVMRNMLQPWVTTAIATGFRPVTKAYMDIGNSEYWRDFWKQGIHMSRAGGTPSGGMFLRFVRAGGGLPFQEEVFRKLGRIPPKASWKNVRRTLAILREANWLSTKPYQMADTINRFISYRAFINKAEIGIASAEGRAALDRFSKMVDRELKKIPVKPVRGRKVTEKWQITVSDIKKSRYRRSRNISTSKELDDVMEILGFNRAFIPIVNDNYKEKLAMLLTGGKIAKGTIEKEGGFIPFALRSPKSISDTVREAFFGKTGKLQDAMAFVSSGDPMLEAMVKAGYNDSFVKKAARQVVAETQWLYERKAQAQYIQKRAFGMFMTWPAHYLDFLDRHLRLTGSTTSKARFLKDKAQKAAIFGTVFGGTYHGLKAVGINPSHIWKSLMLPSGGPGFHAAIDVIRMPTLPEWERETVGRRLKRSWKILPPGYMAIESIYKGIKGEKPLGLGLIGAPVHPEARGSQYERPITSIGWDRSKLTDKRIAAIKRFNQEAKDIRTSMLAQTDPDVRRAMEVEYSRVSARLMELLEPISQYVYDPIAQSDRILEFVEGGGK